MSFISKINNSYRVCALNEEEFTVEHTMMMSIESNRYNTLEKALKAAGKIRVGRTKSEYEFKDDFEPETIEIKDQDGFVVTRYEQKAGGREFTGPDKKMLNSYKTRKESDIQSKDIKLKEKLKSIPSVVSKVKKLFPDASVELIKSGDLIAKFTHKNKRDLQAAIQKLPSTWARVEGLNLNDIRFYYKPNRNISISVGDKVVYLSVR